MSRRCTGGVHHVDLLDDLSGVQQQPGRGFWKSWEFFLLQTGEPNGQLVCRYVMARRSRAGAYVEGGDRLVNHTYTKEVKTQKKNRQNTNLVRF